MRTSRVLDRRVTTALAVALLVSIAGMPTAEAQTTDGPPEIYYTTPQIARTAGGTPVRIYGTGFAGTTSVTFGGVPALDFEVIDSALLTATVPPAPGGPAASNTSVDIVITDSEGSATGTHADGETTGMYYTDATLSVTPDTGLYPGTLEDYGSPIQVQVSDYAADAGGVIIQMSPLVGFLESDINWCANGFCGPPPYIAIEDFRSTDADGNLIWDGYIDNTGYFNEPGGARQLADPNISCSPNQLTADFGLPQCMIGFGQYAVGTVERQVTFRDNPTPAAPTLTLSAGAAGNGDTVEVSGINWNNNAFFGSDTAPDDPGETPLLVEICNGDGTGCQPVTSDASVELTRYRTSSTERPIEGVFTGATLSGSFVVDGSGCAPSCLIRVSQEGFDYDAFTSQGNGTYISATAPLTVGPPATGTTLTCTAGTSGSGAPVQRCTVSDPDGIRTIQVRNTQTDRLQYSAAFNCSDAPSSLRFTVPAGTRYRVVVTDCRQPRNKTTSVIRADGVVRSPL